VVYFFFVETRGYTLEQVKTIFETPGLSWKQRRNMRAPVHAELEHGTSSSVSNTSHEVVGKVARTDEKEVSAI
jgi:hypothetical protein